MISFQRWFPVVRHWTKAAIVWLLIILTCSLSCIRLRGRPPVEKVEEKEEEPVVEAIPEEIVAPVAEQTEAGSRLHPYPEYRLGYGDVIDVRFFYNPQFDQTLTIRPDGRISLPHLGDALVVGMTTTQLNAIITTKYAEIIRDPDVTVIVRQFGEEVVYVLGEVNDPGGYPLNPYGTTVLSAIALAQGFKNTAKLSSVILIKLNAQGDPQAERLNLTRAVGGSRKDDPYLEGNEIVYVPSSFIAQLNLFLDQFFTNMMPPLTFYLKGYDVLNPEQRGYRSQ
jgi:protein involved in polysaccharide export with SLBB domain